MKKIANLNFAMFPVLHFQPTRVIHIIYVITPDMTSSWWLVPVLSALFTADK